MSPRIPPKKLKLNITAENYVEPTEYCPIICARLKLALTQKQSCFIQEYVKEHSVKKAYLAIHPSSTPYQLENQSTMFKRRIFKLPKVVAYYDMLRLRMAVESKPLITTLDLVQRFLKICDNEEEKTPDRLRAMENLAKYTGGFDNTITAIDVTTKGETVKTEWHIHPVVVPDDN